MNTYKTNAKPRCITKDNIPVFCSYDKLLNINDIKLNPDNPNKHPEKQLKMLGEVIKGNGWRQSVTISRLSHLVVKGHGRILAAKMLNLCEIPVEYQEYSNKDEEMADLLADNRIAELAEMDNDMLCSIINDMDEYLLDFTGFTSDEISVILDTLPDITQEFIEDDEIEEEFKLQDKTITQKGDVWCLGKHKLLCGDSTNKDSVLSFMKEERAQLVVTDPPYNVNYSGKTEDALKIKNDDMSDDKFQLFLNKAFDCINEIMLDGACFYIWHADIKGYNFRGACKNINWQVRQCLIWVKNSMVMGRQDYQWKHEPCLYGWKSGAGHKWYADRKQTTILEFNKPTANRLHPTMKPVELIAYQIRNSSKRGDIVFDSFAGSGTTLIACQKNNRICRTIELDERYCDVIVNRYINLSENTSDVFVIRNGKKMSFEEVKN